jgi:hypothetical protein
MSIFITDRDRQEPQHKGFFMNRAWSQVILGAVVACVCMYEHALAQGESSVQNAVLEGIQLSTEKGDKTNETVVTCYFIFIDKPSSYFFEAKRKPNRLVFEFNDTKKGSAPIPSVAEPPMQGFDIEETRIDVNKEVKGLTPEWHDVVRVKFNLDHIPHIVVTDEYNIISFKYKWTSDPSKVKKYADTPNTGKVLLWTVAGLGSAAAIAAILIGPPPPSAGDQPLDIKDLPDHPQDPSVPGP